MMQREVCVKQLELIYTKKLMSSKYECRCQGWECVHGPITDQFSQKRNYLHNILKIKKEENIC